VIRGRAAPGVVLSAAALAVWPQAAASAAFTQFSTPSKNIGCVSDGRYLRCDVRTTTVKAPPQPRSCDLDWGDAFEMTGSSGARRICHGDTALGGRRILGYGRSLRIGPFLCTSQMSGLTCRNRAGHGWFLSRNPIRLF
jgi:hypothetical protein